MAEGVGKKESLRTRAEKIADDIALKAHETVEVDDTGQKWPRMNIWLGRGDAPFPEGEPVSFPEVEARAKGIYRRLAKLEYDNSSKFAKGKTGEPVLEKYYTADPADRETAVKASYDAAFETYWAGPLREAVAGDPTLAREVARVFMDRMDDFLFNNLDDRRAIIRDTIREGLTKMYLPERVMVVSARAEDEAVVGDFLEDYGISVQIDLIVIERQEKKRPVPEMTSFLRDRLARYSHGKAKKFIIGFGRGTFDADPIFEERIEAMVGVGRLHPSPGLSEHRAMWKDNPDIPKGFDMDDPGFIAKQTRIALENAFFQIVKKRAT